MTKSEYKSEKERSGVKSVEEWIRLVEISRATHKSYSCGRRKIPSKKARFITEAVNELVRQRKISN